MNTMYKMHSAKDQTRDQKTFSCCIIGETSLLTRCSELMLDRGHQIEGIISSDPSIRAWADEQGFRHTYPKDDLQTFLKQKPFDYLFSIVNPDILTEEILEIPRKYAINYHDSPLPRYAGMHATSWAIINREPRHGITWHFIVPGVDEGSTLKQRTLALSDQETAFSLNIKCYEAAMESFSELLDELTDNCETLSIQNLEERTYYGKYKRPPVGGVLSWCLSAEEMNAFARALDFGFSHNPLGTPKLAAGSTYFMVPRIQVLPSVSVDLPGTLVGCDDNSLTLATTSHDICIDRFIAPDSTSLSAGDFLDRYKMNKGFRFIDPDPETAGRITELSNAAAKNEVFWTKQFLNPHPVSFPADNLSVESSAPCRYRSLRVQVPDEFTALTVPDGNTAGWEMLLAAFAAYLMRITGMNRFDMGFSHEALGRSLSGLDDIFSACVPFRTAADPSAGFYEFAGLLHQHLDLLKSRGTYVRYIFSRYPSLTSVSLNLKKSLFPVMVNKVTGMDDYTITAGSEFSLILADDVSVCRWVFDPCRVSEKTAGRLKEQFFVFLKAIAAAPKKPLAELPLLLPEEIHKILYQWNDTENEYCRDVCIHKLFEDQAKKHPHNTATVYEGTILTYEELNRKANQLAWHLQKKGVGPETLVGVSLDRSHSMIIALLGILKAGGAYVPLEPSFPRARLAGVIRSAGIIIVISQDKHLGLFEGTGPEVVVLDREASLIAREEGAQAPECRATSRSTAYVIFTSGSTGKPKGVVVVHQPVINLIEWAHKTFSFTDKDSVLFVTALSFDLSVFDLFGLLACGGSIHIVSDEQRKDAASLTRMLCEQEITFWDSAPAALDLLVPGLRARTRPVSNKKLRLVFLSGDWIPLPLADDIRKVFNGAEVVSLGGATEATVWSNYFSIKSVDPAWRSIPYGRPIQNARYYILDQNLSPCPVGVTGDLFIGGECLSEGYLNEPELTAQSFIPDPYCTRQEGKMYRTGDTARYFPEGNIEFLGRKDFQVKVRGYRIELGEIEHALRSHSDVVEALAEVRQDSPGDQKLVAYAVLKAGTAPSIKALKKHAAAVLPDYMVPNVIGFLEAFPLTANGKVDRKALPWPVRMSGNKIPDKELKLSVDKNIIKTAVLNIIREVIQTDELGADGDMFDFGVTSLNLIQIAEKIREQQGLTIRAEVFLDNPTPAGIAAYLQPEIKNSDIKTDISDIMAPCQASEVLAKKASASKSPGPDAGFAAAILNIVREVIQADELGLEDDMFDFGMTSLNLIQIAEKIREQQGLTIRAEVFLDNPTPAGIAAYLQTVSDGPSTETSFSEQQSGSDLSLQPDFSGPVTIELEDVAFNQEAYLMRSSCRRFSSGSISFDLFSGLLSLLRQEIVDNEPRYLYPSAGGLNAVQTYISVRKNRIDGLGEGIYFYNPVSHMIYLITERADIDAEVHYSFNRDAFTSSAFSVFFIAQLEAINPVYTVMSRALVTLDAGYMGQLLLSRQAEFNMALCPVCGLDFERVRQLFKLDSSHMFVYCMLGGPAHDGSVREDSRLYDYMQKTDTGIFDHFSGHLPDRSYLNTDKISQFGQLNTLSEEEHRLLHQKQLHLRNFKKEAVSIALGNKKVEKIDYLLRSTRRSYDDRPVLFAAFSQFMALLGSAPGGEGTAYLYPSISSAYSVKTYVVVKPDAVEGILPGIYYYHPARHVLISVTATPVKNISSAHFPGNRAYYNKAKFCVFLIADLDCLHNVFGQETLHLATLEAGAMGQVLMDRQAEFGLGVCAIGGMRFEKIREDFKLRPDQMLIHSFLCGPVTRTIELPEYRRLMPSASSPKKRSILSRLFS